MDSSVAYVRHSEGNQPSTSYDARYEQYDREPEGYDAYGHGASEAVSLDNGEEFDPPAHHQKRLKTDFASVALQGMENADFWFRF